MKDSNEFDQVDEALGVYVGPATYEDVVQTLRDTPEVAVRIDNRTSDWPQEGIVYRNGWTEYFHVVNDDGTHRDVLVVYKHEQALGYGVMYEDAPLVLRLTPDVALDADQFTGGVRIRSEFGTVLDIAIWHSIQHVTESGDVAPGFGSFRRPAPDEKGEER
jgi:hypothetical protein